MFNPECRLPIAIAREEKAKEKRREPDGERMRGRERRRMLIGLAVALAFGFIVYMRLWAIDYSYSADEAELIRRQFDIANREAMDESAEWRLKYDMEAERATKCSKDLEEVMQSVGVTSVSTGARQKLKTLQKENADLQKQVEELKQELESVKLKCH